jgi:hypothetical protein
MEVAGKGQNCKDNWKGRKATGVRAQRELTYANGTVGRKPSAEAVNRTES